MGKISKIITLILLFLFSQELTNDAIEKSFDLYYEEFGCNEIPSTLLTEISIKGENGEEYSVSGSTIKCSTDGIVQPRCTYTYWYGGAGYIEPFEDQDPDIIEKECYEGVSTVTVTGSSGTKTYEFNVKNYGLIAADKQIDDFIATNITKEMTDLEKFLKISEFPSFFSLVDTNFDFLTTWISTINCEGGSNNGLAKVLVRVCEKIGLKCHIRFGGNEPSKEKKYRNVAALIEDKIYVSNTGIPGVTTPREFTVFAENTGFYFTTEDAADKKITVLQYDGFDEDIVIPGTIEDNTVVSVSPNFLYYGQSISGVKVKSVKLPESLVSIPDSAIYNLNLIKTINLPASLETIGTKAFYYNVNLTSINVETENKNFWSFDGVLFTNDKTKLLFFPTAKSENYTAHEGLITVDDYAFYFCQGVKKISLPPSLTKIGTEAFSTSKIKEIYFGGDQPEIGSNAFKGLDLIVYYPKGNEKWDTSKIKNGATTISFMEWVPTSFPKPGEQAKENDDEKEEKDEKKEENEQKKTENKTEKEGNSTLIIVVVVIVFIILVLIGVFLIIRKKKKNDALEKNVADFKTDKILV